MSNIPVNEKILADNVLVLERYGRSKQHAVLVPQGTSNESFRAKKFGNLSSLYQDCTSHQCFPHTGRLRGFRFEPTLRRVYLYSAEAAVDGGYVCVEKVATADFFEGGCAAFPTTISNHQLAPCKVDPDGDRRYRHSTAAVGRDGKRYATSVLGGIRQYYSTAFAERAEFFRQMTMACTHLATATPMPMYRTLGIPFTFILSPVSTIAVEVEKKVGFTPLLLSTVFSLTAVVRLARHYLPETEQSEIDRAIGDSFYSTEQMTAMAVDGLYLGYRSIENKGYLIIIDCSEKIEPVY